MDADTSGDSPERGGIYWPRHEAPEPDFGLLERQAQAADDYRYSQMTIQFRAEYAAVRGPLQSDMSPQARQDFVDKQQQAAVYAIVQQKLAKDYADSRRSIIDSWLFGSGEEYAGRHRAREGYVGRHQAQPEPDNESPPSIVVQPAPDIVRSSPASENGMQAEEVANKTDEPLRPPAGEQRSLWKRTNTAWYAAGATVGAYFGHPEKGKRRQVMAVVLGYAALAGAGWLFGKHLFDSDSQPPTQPMPAHPEGPQLTAEFVDKLQPHDYHGEAHEWTVVAKQLGAAEATPSLQAMIGQARTEGLQVATWGSPEAGHWGISSVTVKLSDGNYLTYSDTPHKLALIEYLSSLARAKG